MLGVIESVGNVISTVVTRIWPDATEAEKAKLTLLSQELEQEFKVQIAQIQTNIESARHASVFVAGARPFIMWVCGSALAYAAIIEPIARFAATVIFGYVGAFPVIDTDITLQILLGVLGLGAARTYEKTKGVARDKV